jgi:hypothetical protein
MKTSLSGRKLKQNTHTNKQWSRAMTIHAKLIEFHKKFNGAKKTGVNPHFKSEHFTLDDVIHATTPIMNELGLCAYHYIDGGEMVSVIATDEGDSITSRIPMALNGNPQAAGSMVTYYKRYNLCALLNIAEADDDGNAAAAAAPKLISDKTLIELKDLAAGNNERVDFVEKRGSGLSEDQARAIITKWKEHQ